MTRRVFWLAAGLALLTFWCGLSFVLLSGGYEVFPVLVWFLGVLFLVASFVSPDPAQHEPVGEVPSASPTGYFNERNTLEHTDITLHTHTIGQCVGPVCPIHHRSNHAMRSWPQNWRPDRHIMERICPHGVGHPDPDDVSAVYDSVHGCDGCCFELAWEASEDAASRRTQLTEGDET